MNPTRRATLALVSAVVVSLTACGKKDSDLPDLSSYVKHGPTSTPVPTAPPVQAPTAPIANPVEPKDVTPTPTSSEAPKVVLTTPIAATKPAKPVKFAKANNVAAEYSRYALGKGQYWESIVAQVEGYRSSFYRDNIGAAVGFGYNASYQKPETNHRAGVDVLKSATAAHALVSLSGDMNPAKLPQIQVDADQAMGMSRMLRPQYEDPMRAWIPGFERLKPHQQAVLIYHSYKLGAAGAKKYPVLKDKIAAMLANPTEGTTRAAAAQFQYTYKVGGETKTDTRSTVYMQALWNDPKAYEELIGGKASTFVATLPEFKDSGKSSVSEDDISDPIGEVKSEMERTGKRIPITLEVSRPRQGIILPNF